jgi:hypothetical protein
MPTDFPVFDLLPSSYQDSIPGRIPTKPLRFSRFRFGSDSSERLL